MKNRAFFIYITLLMLSLFIFFIQQSLLLLNNPKPLQEHDEKDISLTLKKTPLFPQQFDVIIIGTDPEGISAAISAARLNQKTLLIDTRPKLGGLFTLGKLNSLDMNYNKKGELLTKGIFLEFFKKIGKRSSFDVLTAELVFHEMVQEEENITLMLETKEITPNTSSGRINSLTLLTENGLQTNVSAPYFIDATQDADIAFHGGAPFTFGQEDINGERTKMAATLVFELSGVDWKKVKSHLNDFHHSPIHGANATSAWGYHEMKKYDALENNIRVRGLNIGRLDNGNVLINGLQILHVDGTNKQDRMIAKQKAKAELPRIVEYMKKHLIGFENATLVDIAEELYIRETRHLIGLYRLSIDDVLEHRDFNDKIALGSYPVDIQATTLTSGDLVVGNPDQYSIPFRSIVPIGWDNLLIVGRSASYDSLAHGSARVVPVGMVVAEVAGIAATYAHEQHITLPELATSSEHIRNIQEIARRQGVYLPKIDSKAPIITHSSYPAITFFRKHGLIFAGYHNNYHLDKRVTKSEFHQFAKHLADLNLLTTDLSLPIILSDQHVTKKDITLFLEMNNLTGAPPTKINRAWMYEFFYNIIH